MNHITLKSYPETGRYRLYSNQTGSCTFFDARDRFAAKTYAIGSIGMMVSDQHGTLTDLSTGESWGIAVQVTALSADERADFNSNIRAEFSAVSNA